MEANITQFITEELLHDYEDITLTAEDRLLTSGLIDSLGVMQLINFLEEEFGVDVSPEDVTIENFQTVNMITQYISRQRN